MSQILIPFTKFHFTEIFWFVFVRSTQKVVRGWELGHWMSANLQDRGAQGNDATCLEWLSLSSFSFKSHFKNENIKYSTYFNSCLKKGSALKNSFSPGKLSNAFKRQVDAQSRDFRVKETLGVFRSSHQLT